MEDDPTAGDDALGDGRHQRSARSRRAVVDALLALYEEGNLQPGGAEIAARAGVSERSVFRHFRDLEALAATAIEVQWPRIAPLFEPPESQPSRAGRIEALVQHRLALHDRIMPVARVANRMAVSSPTVAGGVARRRAALDHVVATTLAPDLAEVDEARREVVLRALESVTSLEAVDYQRDGVGMDRKAVAASLRFTIGALLDAGTEREPAP